GEPARTDDGQCVLPCRTSGHPNSSLHGRRGSHPVAQGLPAVSRDLTQLSFARDRIHDLLRQLESLAAGETETGLPISPRHDELDAIVFGINVLADELRWAHARITESERAKADVLRDELAHLGRVAMLDVLAGSLAHEINQPLTGATANAAAALLLLNSDPPRLRELRGTLNDIVNDSRRAAAVVHNMRTL